MSRTFPEASAVSMAQPDLAILSAKSRDVSGLAHPCLRKGWEISRQTSPALSPIQAHPNRQFRESTYRYKLCLHTFNISRCIVLVSTPGRCSLATPAFRAFDAATFSYLAGGLRSRPACGWPRGPCTSCPGSFITARRATNHGAYRRIEPAPADGQSEPPGKQRPGACTG